MGKGQYHLNLKGEPGECNADKGSCPFIKIDPNTPHFDTKEEARDYYEKSQQNDTIIVISKGGKKSRAMKKFVAIGGALTMTFTVAACGQQDEPDNFQPNPNNAKIQEATAKGDPQKYRDSGKGTKENEAEVTKKKIKDEASSVFGKAKNGAAKAAKKVKEESPDFVSGANKAMDKGEDAIKKGGEVFNGAIKGHADENRTTDSSGIYFQGKTLQPTAKEIQQAKETLKTIIVNEENKEVDYDRERDYGVSFTSGTVGKMEHRDVTHGVFKNAAPQSRAISGWFVDPYTNNKVNVSTKDKTDSDVDHVVSLKEASESGPAGWNDQTEKAKEKRVAYANDPEVLAIVSYSANRQKSDKDIAEWKPSYDAAVCPYVISQINIKAKYNFTTDLAEKNEMTSLLNSRCVSK